MTRKVHIAVWSDYVCPFCYLEEPVLERIRQEYGEAVDVEWRAFELRPQSAGQRSDHGHPRSRG